MEQITARVMLIAGITAAGTLLSACSGTDVELKGGVFDMMGVSGLSSARAPTPKMPNRPGIVIPPSTASLPAPGGAPQQTALTGPGGAFPVDPEKAKKAKLAELAARHQAFCAKSRQRFEAGLTPTLENSPWGACHQSILRNFTGRDVMGRKAVGAQ